LLGSKGGFNRVYGGNLKARVGYCDAVSAAVGAETTVDVVADIEVELELFVSATVVEPEPGTVVVDELFDDPYAGMSINNEIVTIAATPKTRLNIFIS